MRWVALITLMLPLIGSAAEPLGRLFFSPGQRATLDNARKQNIKIDVETETPTPEIISVNGMIRRSDGLSTVWVNNQPLNEKHAPSGIKIISRSSGDARVTLQLPPSSRNVDLKVGQDLDAISGQIQESYQRRPLPPLNEKITTPSAQSTQLNAVASPAPSSDKPKSRISSKADDEAVREPPAPDNEQPAIPSPPQPPTVQY
jgi:hypothetical protein